MAGSAERKIKILGKEYDAKKVRNWSFFLVVAGIFVPPLAIPAIIAGGTGLYLYYKKE